MVVTKTIRYDDQNGNGKFPRQVIPTTAQSAGGNNVLSPAKRLLIKFMGDVTCPPSARPASQEKKKEKDFSHSKFLSLTFFHCQNKIRSVNY